MATELEIIEKRIPPANKWDVASPALARCSCKRLIVLESSHNECECGKAYNLVGNRIRNQASMDAERYGDDS